MYHLPGSEFHWFLSTFIGFFGPLVSHLPVGDDGLKKIEVLAVFSVSMAWLVLPG